MKTVLFNVHSFFLSDCILCILFVYLNYNDFVTSELSLLFPGLPTFEMTRTRGAGALLPAYTWMSSGRSNTHTHISLM